MNPTSGSVWDRELEPIAIAIFAGIHRAELDGADINTAWQALDFSEQTNYMVGALAARQRIQEQQ